MNADELADIVEIEQLLAKYASAMTRDEEEEVMEVFTPDRCRGTEAGWRLANRQMTFLRKSGARDSGKPHDPLRPVPGDDA